LILISFVASAATEKLAVPMVSVLALLPSLGLLLKVSVTLPTHVAVPMQLSFTVATPFRTPRLAPSSLTVATAGGGFELTTSAGPVGVGAPAMAQLDARPLPVAVIFPIRPS
jgi:hypothetical protein